METGHRLGSWQQAVYSRYHDPCFHIASLTMGHEELLGMVQCCEEY